MEQPIVEGTETPDMEEWPVAVEATEVVEAEDEALEEFKRQVNYLVEKMQEDPEVRDRIIAETYVNIANMETAIRNTFAMFQNEGGPMAMIKMMMGRGKKEKND